MNKSFLLKNVLKIKFKKKKLNHKNKIKPYLSDTIIDLKT